MISFGYVVFGIILGLAFIISVLLSVPFYGLWVRYIYVRLRGGGLCLVKFKSGTDDYHRVGKISKMTIRVKKRNAKENTELTIPKNRPVFYRSMGSIFTDIDETTNGFVTVNFDAVEGFDEETYEQIVVRAMMKETMHLNWKLLFIGIGVAALASVAALLLMNHIDSLAIQRHGELIDTIKAGIKACQTPTI